MRTLLILFLVGCFLPELTGQQAPVEKVRSVAVYKPSAFADADRLKSLEKIFPAVDEIYKSYAKKNHIPGMAYGIVADGKLIHSGVYGELNLKSKGAVTTQSLFRIASMTKSFTAMAILKLQDDGKLNITDPASRYVPEMKEFVYLTPDTKPITIQQLLTMTAGFPEDNPWGDRQLEDTDAEFLAFLKNGISFSTTPGQAFEYSNMGYAILGNLITRVSGMPYQEYITKNILKPLGMNDTQWEFTKVSEDALVLGYRWEDDEWKAEPMLHDGAYGAMGGLLTSIEDFSKYLAFHLSAYPNRNEKEQGPVNRSTVREMHKPYMPNLFAQARAFDGTNCPVMTGYGFGFGVRQDCSGVRRISHSGGLPGFGSEYRFYPDLGIGVICFANLTYAGAGAPNSRALDTLVNAGRLKVRMLPSSDILIQFREQLIPILNTWDSKKANELFAENFFLDLSRERWMRMSKEIFEKTGRIKTVGPMNAENQLRGYFIMEGEHKNIRVYFTLSPERNPKIQELDLTLAD